VRSGGLGRGLCGSIAAAVLLACGFLASSAQAITYAPVDQPGPPLSVPQSALDASLHCQGTIAGHTPVLLVPGTGGDPAQNYAWSWEPALTALGIPWCDVTLPDHTQGDVQIAAEYVVNAIRIMHTAAGGRVSVIGHSQGGMLPRWVFRFWPDTRSMVDDDIGFAASNHGTTTAALPCSFGCSPADWQQSNTSQFIKALNSYQETFPGISYTEVYTHTDEIVQPNSNDSGSSSVHGGGGEITNVAIQQICPLDLSEHLALGTQDNTAYALAIDALSHSGPANPAAIPSSVCTDPLMPGINKATYPVDLANSALGFAQNVASAPQVKSEPPLKCYVTASCKSGAGKNAGTKKKCKKHKRRRGHKAESSKRHHCKKKHKRRR
jgi:triacylglycerol esterase/lipase EstA (alpha/beta hydrolase family)